MKKTKFKIRRKRSDCIVEPNAALAWDLDYREAYND